MSSISIENTDVRQSPYGWLIDEDPGWLDSVNASWNKVAFPDRYGQVYDRRPYVEPRILKLTGTVTGTSTLDREQREAKLRELCTGKLVRIQVDTGTTTVKITWGYCRQWTAKLHVSSILSFTSRITALFECPDASWTDGLPMPYGLDAVRRYIPTGDAPVAPIWRLFGAATNPVLTVRGLSGDALAACTFTVVLASSDWIEADALTGRVDYITPGGGRVDGFSLLSGDNIPAIDPRDLDVAGGYGFEATLSAGTGMVILPKRFT